MSVLRQRYAALSRREREVLELVLSGWLNKQIAAKLGISEITVKVHRGTMMRKMCADSFLALLKTAMRLHLMPVTKTESAAARPLDNYTVAFVGGHHRLAANEAVDVGGRDAGPGRTSNGALHSAPVNR